MNRNASDWQVIQSLFDELRPLRASFFGALILYFPVAFFAVAQPMIIGAAVQYGFRTKDFHQVLLWTGIFVLAIIMHASSEMLQHFLMQRAGQGLVKGLRTKMFSKIQRLPVQYFDHTPLGRILTRVTNDVESIADLFSSGAVQIFGDLLFLVGTFIMLYIVNVRLALSTLVVLPILVLGLSFFRRWTRDAYHRVRSVLARLNGYSQEYISGMGTLQALAQVDSAFKGFDEHVTEYMIANRRAILLDAAVYSFVDAVSYFTIAALLWWASGLYIQGALQLGALVTFVEALNRFFQPIRDLSTNYAVLQSALVAGQRVTAFLHEPEEELGSKTSAPIVFDESLAFENVSFSYTGEIPAVHDVSFEVKKGQKIALVGHTGAGKSTVIKLATRFYDATLGRITVDGEDVRVFPAAAVRKLYNVVLQEVFLFSGTLRDNLRYGKPDASDHDIWQALHLCQAQELVRSRGGLDLVVLSRGQNFSLGERQLFALARALIADPQILILDEATASIDRDTERRLQAATKEVLKNRTSLIIAHRLSTITDCDRILVFHRGHIVEQGAHQELLEKDGIYAKLIELQKFEGPNLETYPRRTCLPVGV